MSEPTKYLIIVERDEDGFSAYCPDLPGCAAAADSLDETLQLMHEAISLHIEGLLEDGLDIPEPTTQAEYYSIQMTAS